MHSYFRYLSVAISGIFLLLACLPITSASADTEAGTVPVLMIAARFNCVSFASVLSIAQDTAQVSTPVMKPAAYSSPFLSDPFAFQTWEKSKDAPTEFTVPDQYAPLIMGKAQELISGWKERDAHNNAVMKIQTSNDTMIDTQEPFEVGQYGLNVTSVKALNGRRISVKSKSYTGAGLFNGRERKDAGKRATLLSFLLQEYAKEISSSPDVAEPVQNNSAKKSNIAPEIDAMLTSLRALIDAGQTDAALAQLDVLKTMLQRSKSK